MPKYLYKCPDCGAQKQVVRTFADTTPVRCYEHAPYDAPIDGNGRSYFPHMQRQFTASFQIIAHREQDKRENKLYDILTKGGTEADKLALYKQDMARQEATMNAIPDVAKEFTTEDILNTGICEAARSGEVGIANWRKEHIPVKTYKEGEAITA